jgi:hypothetical protein
MSAAASYDCAPRSSLSGVALAAVQAALVAPVRAGGTYVALSKEWLDAFSRGCAAAADLSVNDGDEHADQLLALVRDVPCKFNLIPFNPFPGADLRRSPAERIKAFARRLSDAGIVTTVRRTRGDDIDAACGQLAGDIVDRTRLAQRGERRRVAIARA